MDAPREPAGALTAEENFPDDGHALASEDPIGSFHGVIIGLALGLFLWGAVALLLWVL